jgi:hypothetical protein
MLKTVSSVANAIGALNYKGTWNASTNTPTLASGVGAQGDYYVVSVAGATNLDGITNWGIGDWATFNGSVWQRVEGGADGNFVNLDVTGTSNLAAIAGTGNVVLGNTITNPASNYANQRGFGWNDSTKVLEISSSGAALELGRTSGGGDGQVLVFRQAANTAAAIRVEGNAGYFKPYNGGGIDFSETAGTGTSEILDDYEEGNWTPTIFGSSTAGTYELSANTSCTYVKIGELVTIIARIYTDSAITAGGTGNIRISGLPFSMSGSIYGSPFCGVTSGIAFTGSYISIERISSSATTTLYVNGVDNAGTQTQIPISNVGTSDTLAFQFTYRV